MSSNESQTIAQSKKNEENFRMFLNKPRLVSKPTTATPQLSTERKVEKSLKGISTVCSNGTVYLTHQGITVQFKGAGCTLSNNRLYLLNSLFDANAKDITEQFWQAIEDQSQQQEQQMSFN